MANPQTLQELLDSGYRHRSVKDELRENLIAALREGRELFPGIIGYDRTVVPQIQNAILGKHDFILLGLRGQAKTRLARALTELLDPEIPVLAGFPLHEDPLAPLSDAARAHVEEHEGATRIAWLPRSRRYQEKLATPDVSVADLIGDIDPIKAANLRLDYADERVIHYGIIPRSNRGIFCINELPDLAPRIQVALLNIMQERDIQIRGFPVRLPIDLLMVYTANPEDYTNRGSIITPLKDRIDSQIHTHYPLSLAHARTITEQEAWVERQTPVTVPDYLRDVVEEVGFQARESEFLDHSSGVSARLSITLLEAIVSNAERRALLAGEEATCVRPIDFQQAVAAVTGKVELVYQGEQEGALNVARHLIGKALKVVFDRLFPDVYAKVEGEKEVFGPYRDIVQFFSQGHRVEVSDQDALQDVFDDLERVDGLVELANQYLQPRDDQERVAAMEFVLEGLHQAKVLAKSELEGVFAYRDMLGSMLEGIDLGER
ncbi:MAG: magnesium chelatase [Planctomycetes bacterium]|nr:magnesium chelatase [Planctomycetota bacterium]